MDILKVKTQAKEYPIYIKNNFDELLNAFKNISLYNKKICIITDTNVEKIYIKEILDILEGNFSKICYYSFKAGEQSKNLDTINKFYEFLLNNQFDRQSAIIALGGGVTGDMAGFLASTYMRGIKYVQIPTTLLSQVDSSVGGKVGVDFKGNKNMIGAFYQPEFVYINTSTLKTLPSEEFSVGMAEAIKYGYIIDREYLEMIENNKNKIKDMDFNALYKLIFGACKAKAYVVSKDEKENGMREILNFGHTFGHAIETLSGFKLLHGQCVCIGMVCGLYLSLKLGNISIYDIEKACELFKFFNLPVKASEYDKYKILEQMKNDKKNKQNKINLILLSKIGEAYTDDSISDDEILNALEQII